MCHGALSSELAVDPATPSMARRLLRCWLDEGECLTGDHGGGHEDVLDDLVFAISEIVTNCVEHAYENAEPGLIVMHAITTTDAAGVVRVVVTVTDNGQWRIPDADIGFRGRGLAMAARQVSELRVNPSASGTTVELTSHPMTHS